MDWFLYDIGLRHERVKQIYLNIVIPTHYKTGLRSAVAMRLYQIYCLTSIYCYVSFIVRK